MKYTNEPSAKTAVSWGCHLVDEFSDEVNELIYHKFTRSATSSRVGMYLRLRRNIVFATAKHRWRSHTVYGFYRNIVLCPYSDNDVDLTVK